MLRYLISDLHLSDKRLDLIQAFMLLTNQICDQDEPSELYILGDFFEAYIGDDYQPEWIQALDQQFQKLHQQGIKTYFIAGNRDFLVGIDWLERNHIHLLNEQSLLQLGSKQLDSTEQLDKTKQVILTHGDEFCTDDQAYQQFRAMVRQPSWQQQVLAMPLEQRLALAQKLRDDSKSMSSEKNMAIMDVNQDAIKASLPSNSSLLIHGHTHRPCLHQDEATARLVLGDWDSNVWLAIISGNDVIQVTAPLTEILEQNSKYSDWEIRHQLAL